MSYSRVEYPRTTRTQSRNRRGSRPPYNPQPINRSMDDNVRRHSGSGDQVGEEAEEASGGPRKTTNTRTEERSMQRHGAHYMLPPNPSKNEQLRHTAEEEKRLHERHRDQDRRRIAAEQRVHGPSPLGGQELSAEELGDIRRRQERDQQLAAKYSGIQRKQRRDSYEQARREREEEELQKKKQIQREKARKLNEQRSAQAKLDQEEIRRKRLAYLEAKT